MTHFEAPCAMCHEDVRPPAPHPAGECSSCHTFPDWSQVSVASFSHTPKPETCEGCHARPQEVASRAYPNQGPPANFDPNLPSDGGGHYVGKDCVSCHQTPDEGQAQFTFTHSQPPADFCLPCHYNNGQEEHANDDFAQFEGFGNCFECHQAFDAQNNRNFDPVN